MIKLLFSVNWPLTIFFNFKYFRISQAFKLPVILFGLFDLQRLSGKISISKNADLRLGMIKIGKHSVGIFDRKKRTILNIHGEILFNGSATIGRGTALSIGENSKLIFGNNFQITASSTIIASGGCTIQIGNDCLFSWDVLIMNTDFHKIIIENVIVNSPADVIIGNHVWICTGALILKGSYLPNGSIIGAKSIVNKTLSKQNSLYAGTPIIEVKSNVFWSN